MAGDNLKTVLLALSKSISACGVRGVGVPDWAQGDLVEYPSSITFVGLDYTVVGVEDDAFIDVVQVRHCDIYCWCRLKLCMAICHDQRPPHKC